MRDNILPKSVRTLAEILATLPGVGPKTANRLTFYLLSRNDDELKRFGEILIDLKKNLTNCSDCHIIAEVDPCPICANRDREREKLAVVEESLDVIALEKAHFNGIYHVLGGQISPINNVGPEDLKIKELLERLTTDDFKEVILAMDPTLEGEATVMYVDEKIAEARHGRKGAAKLIVSRLARGLPVGGDLEYADELTLTRALEGRRSYSSPD